MGEEFPRGLQRRPDHGWYSGYNQVQGAERAGCWAHMRRKWLDAMPEGADAKTCKAAQGYEFCNRLFELERQFEELTAEERLMQRKEKSGPVLEAYWTWLNTIPRPTGKLKDAVTYAQNQKAHLCAFLEHGEIEISNNQVENAIRPFVVGRKGWLFADTPPRGGGECNHLFPHGNGKSQQPAAG